MKAARFHGPGDIRIDDVPETRGRARPGRGDGGLVRHLRHRPARVPRGPDLHPAGRIAAPAHRADAAGGDGPRVRRRGHGGRLGREQASARATGSPSSPTTCAASARPARPGRYNICRFLGFVGLAGQQGGFAEKCVVEGRWAHPLGDLPTDLGALVEPLAVGYHAVRLSGLRPGGTAAVFGAGPIGLVTAAALMAAGAGKVIVVEPAAARKAKAPGCGRRRRARPDRDERARRDPRPDRRRRRRTSRSSAPASTPCSPPRSARCAPAGPSSTSRSGGTCHRWR